MTSQHLETQLGEILASDGVKALIQLALDEDIGSGDATSIALVPQSAMGVADLVAREACVMCGGPLAEIIFKHCDSDVKIELLVKEGTSVEEGTTLIRIHGHVRGTIQRTRNPSSRTSRRIFLAWPS